MNSNTIPLIGGVRAHKREINPTLLDQWIKAHGVSQLKLSRLIGCMPKTVEYWCKGQTMPDLVSAYFIEKVTEGGVPATSWLGTAIGKLVWNNRCQLADEACLEHGIERGEKHVAE